MTEHERLKSGYRRGLWVFADCILVNLSLLLSQFLRYTTGSDPAFYAVSLRLAPFMTVIFILCFAIGGLYSTLCRYMTAADILRVTGLCLCASLLTYLFSLLANRPAAPENRFMLHRFIYLLQWIISSFLVSVTRLAARAVFRGAPRTGKEEPVRVLVVGAGWAGAALVHDMQQGRYGNRRAVVIADDDRERIGSRIGGVRIVRGTGNILKLVSDYGVQEIYIAIATPEGDLTRVIEKCLVSGCRVKRVLPPAEVHLSDLRKDEP